VDIERNALRGELSHVLGRLRGGSLRAYNKRMIVDTEQHDEDEQHEAGFPCPVCDVITIRQPWPSLIALGFKHYEFRSRNSHHRGAIVIHAGVNWYAGGLRDIIWTHFRNYTRNPNAALQALFPFGVPVADAVVRDCKQWTDDPTIKDKFALSLTQVRIITQPKPVLKGLQSITWPTERTKELASALSRARVLEGVEKNSVYQEFELMALRNKINDWLRANGLAEFALTPPRG
jgi:hypothetical protein